MAGIVDLDELLSSLSPQLADGEYVFCTVDGPYSAFRHLKPIACFREAEGLTLVLPKAAARQAEIEFTEVFSLLTLQVHSSLAAVGLTAAVAAALAARGISANVMAAYYHDHIFVPVDKAAEALAALNELGKKP